MACKNDIRYVVSQKKNQTGDVSDAERIYNVNVFISSELLYTFTYCNANTSKLTNNSIKALKENAFQCCALHHLMTRVLT